MYELINTSVPNGLIAGTHGFATVAMTKGMPDAIRTRVESFCAYPHRTSAHDQSYFRDNPVNWFHLQIPSGDHVVGRTAPADFDYTGRTNRIAHTLVFGAKEMSIVGGAYILGAESRRFLAEWSGDPKYLTVDKLTAGRLGLADIPKNTTPTNWTATFGDDGAKYARRFAALVAKNVSGGNKCVYFKTSTAWDGDGTRLLGLFADLINLLPEGIRPFVTFSTFAACVPNGVACHLRGVYDKDRAFEIASATQPWVDCEHGRIAHEELLPEECENATAIMGGKTDVLSSAGGHRLSASQNGIPLSNATHGTHVENGRSSTNRVSKLIIGIMVLVVVGAMMWWFGDDIERAMRTPTPEESAMEQEMKESQKNERIIAEQERQRKARELAAAVAEQEKEGEERNARIQAEERRRNDEVARKAKREKEENEARQRDREKIVADAKERQKVEAAAEKKAMAEERAEWPRKINAENVLFDKTLDDVVLEEGGMKFVREYSGMQLTNEESIVVHWRDKDGTLQCKTTAYVENSKTDPRSRNKTISYKLKDDVGCEATWVVYRLILGPWDRNLRQFSKERVFWMWRKGKYTSAVFQEKGTLDIQKTFFAGNERLYALWSQIRVPKYFKYEFVPASGASDELVVWLKDHYYVGDCWAAVKEDVVKLVLRKENEKLQRLQKDLDNADKERSACAGVCHAAQADVETALAKNEEMKKTKKDEKGFGNKSKKATLWEEIKKILRPYFKSGTEFKTANFASYIQEVKSKTKCHHPYEHDKERLEKAKVAKENSIKQLEEALKNMVLNVGALNGSCGKGTGISKKQDVRFDNEDSDGSDF